MDLTKAANDGFESAAKKAARRLSVGPRRKSKVRRAERRDPAERLMDRIVKASRPDHMSERKVNPHG